MLYITQKTAKNQICILRAAALPCRNGKKIWGRHDIATLRDVVPPHTDTKARLRRNDPLREQLLEHVVAAR